MSQDVNKPKIVATFPAPPGYEVFFIIDGRQLDNESTPVLGFTICEHEDEANGLSWRAVYPVTPGADLAQTSTSTDWVLKTPDGRVAYIDEIYESVEAFEEQLAAGRCTVGEQRS